jgi:hypothetical protein
VLENLMTSIAGCRLPQALDFTKELEFGRKVAWFPERSKRELSALIHKINAAHLKTKELLLVGAVLSATVREVSFCRQDGWKLHRIAKDRRKIFSPSALEVFRRRFRIALDELRTTHPLKCAPTVLNGDARQLSQVLNSANETKRFDVVITSPPYGDSRTTVQYGAMSGLCLGVLRYLNGFDFDILRGGEIDARCLGGSWFKDHVSRGACLLTGSKYWRGGIRNSARYVVERYLVDFRACCWEVFKVVKRRGTAIFVISRRSVGGWRLNLDQFLIDTFVQGKFRLEGVAVRKIQGKTVPNFVNRLGRNIKHARRTDRVSTMREEYVLAFRKL